MYMLDISYYGYIYIYVDMYMLLYLYRFVQNGDIEFPQNHEGGCLDNIGWKFVANEPENCRSSEM